MTGDRDATRTPDWGRNRSKLIGPQIFAVIKHDAAACDFKYDLALTNSSSRFAAQAGGAHVRSGEAFTNGFSASGPAG